jgi:hypothetical protein
MSYIGQLSTRQKICKQSRRVVPTVPCRLQRRRRSITIERSVFLCGDDTSIMFFLHWIAFSLLNILFGVAEKALARLTQHGPERYSNGRVLTAKDLEIGSLLVRNTLMSLAWFTPQDLVRLQQVCRNELDLVSQKQLVPVALILETWRISTKLTPEALTLCFMFVVYAIYLMFLLHYGSRTPRWLKGLTIVIGILCLSTIPYLFVDTK